MTLIAVPVNGVRLATADQGRGRTVLLVHGFPLDHRMWEAQIETLSGRFRVLAPDLRGCGRSEATEGTVGMSDYADDLAGLVDAVGAEGPIAICGLSMGGYIALEFWRRYPERLSALVLCDTRAAPDSADAAAGRLKTADRLLREGPRFLAEEMLPKLLAPATRENRPEVVESLRRIILENDPKGLAAALRGMAARRDFRPLLPRVECPALVLAGEFDAVSPVEEMRSFAVAMPRSRFVSVSAAGHMTPVENPRETSDALVDFLASLPWDR